MDYLARTETIDNLGASLMMLSEDGYVRLELAKLLNTPLEHLLSGLDEEPPISQKEGASAAVISGYTEWISSTKPAITLGWDWYLDATEGSPRCIRVGSPRSNVMLLDTEKKDLGAIQTDLLLESAIDAIPWQQKTFQAICTRYQ